MTTILVRHVLVGVLTLPLAAQGMVLGTTNAIWIAGVGDVNGDGREDLLVSYTDPVTAAQSFRVIDPVTNTALPWLERAVASPFSAYIGIGDINDDGCADLVYVADFVFAPTQELISGLDGSTLLTEPLSTSGLPAFADFVGDGRTDRFQSDSSGVTVVSGRTGATLFQLSGSSLVVSRAGDENGDGCEDMLVVQSGAISTIVRGPAGASAGPFNVLNPIGDATGDGRADFLLSPGPAPWFPPFLLAGGSLTNAGAIPGVGGYWPGARAAGDLDGDGHADFLIGTLAQPVSGATLGAMPGVSLPAGVEASADVDGDGRSELFGVSTLFGGGTTTICEWNDPAVPVASLIVRHGVSGSTHDGRKPTLVTRGHCGLGHTVFFDMRGGLPNGLTLLFYGSSLDVDLAPLGAPNNRCYTSLAGGLAFVANGNGVAQYQATMPVSPSLLGASLSLQSIAVDPAANALGLVTSNAIDITTNN